MTVPPTGTLEEQKIGGFASRVFQDSSALVMTMAARRVDVIHDAADPIRPLKTIRAALPAEGLHVCLEMNCAEKLEDNRGPHGALFHAISVLYCMTTSLASGGIALGTLGLHERKLRELASVAGFREIRRLPVGDPFNILYELRP
jgi:hypothetical protein